jgi:hypothetical protein
MSIIVDGKEVTQEELQELQKKNDLKLKLVESSNTNQIYKTLKKMEG